MQARDEVRPSGLHVVLHRPEIPPNTGNIIRLCANTGALLHVIKPLGFVMDDTRLRRAGLDYHEFASVCEWESLDDYIAAHRERRLVAIETSGQCLLADFVFSQADSLLFGSETKGLPDDVLALVPAEQVVRLPMLAHSRSLNLSNAAAVAVYEAWRQLSAS